MLNLKTCVRIIDGAFITNCLIIRSLHKDVNKAISYLDINALKTVLWKCLIKAINKWIVNISLLSMIRQHSILLVSFSNPNIFRRSYVSAIVPCNGFPIHWKHAFALLARVLTNLHWFSLFNLANNYFLAAAWADGWYLLLLKAAILIIRTDYFQALW